MTTGSDQRTTVPVAIEKRTRRRHAARAVSAALVIAMSAAVPAVIAEVRKAPTLPSNEVGAQYYPTTSEVMALPSFCWGAFLPEFKGKGPQYDIGQIPNCGNGTNHFCPGLVALNKARRAVDGNMRRRWVGQANGELQYTLRNIKAYPSCSLHEPLQRALNEWRALELHSR
jgi:hypothetical protein